MKPSEMAVIWAAGGAFILGIVLFIIGPALFGRMLRRNHERRLKDQGLDRQRDPGPDDPA